MVKQGVPTPSCAKPPQVVSTLRREVAKLERENDELRQLVLAHDHS